MDRNIVRKFRIIIWKNFIIRKRHWLLTAFEIIIPILLFLLLAYVRGSIKSVNRSFQNSTTYFDPKNIGSLSEDISADTNIFYTRNTQFYEDLMEDVRIRIGLPAPKLYAFTDEDSLVYNYTQFSLHNSDETVMAIIFDDESNLKVPKNLKYSIRTPASWETELMFPQFSYPGPMSSDGLYLRSGFLTLQSAIDDSFITKTRKNSNFLYEILLQCFPYPPYMNDLGFSEIYNIVLPVLTVISFLFLCPSLLKRVVEEKQTGIKELMKLMGLQSWMLWFGWLIHSLVVNVLSITVIVLLLKIPWSSESDSIIPLCNGFLLWFFLLLYVVASICFCFFISSWFSRPTIAMTIAIFIWILTYFVIEPLTNDPKQSFQMKLLFALFPNICVLFGYQSIATFEVRDVGLKWSNIFEIASGNPNDFSMGFTYIMLIFDIAFYATLTWYIDNIKPGKYGLARPWYFPFLKSFWIPSKVEDSELGINGSNTNQRNYEEPPKHLKAGIKINNLRKVYGTMKAVNGLTMDIYNGEITALLGHNGAGKTTTMSILTGMFAPTSGDVSIHDYNIRTQLNNVRDVLGLCPQHNMLFTDLTVIEHLIFFARLKGKSRTLAKIEADKLLGILNLSNKSNNRVDTLSGGMKRKLSLGIALVGDAQVLMLDEPTSGMDPEARREVWDLLLRMRGPDKVIVITTHFMEEADVLGDRIAIMDHGTLQCYGTSMFLKKKYGAGYQLSLIKADDETDINKITNIVNQHIPNGRLKYNNAGLITYTLPTDDNDKFSKLFHNLETSKSELHINGIGLSVTTLEEVFLRVGEIVEEEQSDSNKKPNFYEDCVDGSDEKLIALKENNGFLLEFIRLKTLLLKKCIFTKRKYILFPILCSIPIVMTLATILLGARGMNGNSSADPPLTLNLNKFGETFVYYTSVPATTDLGQISKVYGNSLPANKIGMPVANVNDGLIKAGINNIAQFREMLIVAAEFNQSKYLNGSNYVQLNAMYSTIALHAAPISLNMITNALLKFLSGNDHSITVVNHPLEKKTASSMEVQQLMANVQIIMLWFIIMPLGFLIMLGGFINFPLIERVSKAKQLQLMTGLKPITYWFSSYLWDLLLYFLITFVVVFFVIGIFDSTNTFNGRYELSVLFSLFILYGLSGILYSYFVSFLRGTVPGAFAFLLISSIIIGLMVTSTTFAMTKSHEWKNWGENLEYIFSLIPHYAFSLGLLKFSTTALDNNKCKLMPPKLREFICSRSSEVNDVCCKLNCTASEHCQDRISYLNGEYGIQNLLIMLMVDILIYFGIIMLIEYNVFTYIYESIMNSICGSSSTYHDRRDSDVVNESMRVNNYLKPNSELHDEDNLLVHELEKRYRKHVAVRGVSFGVHSGECFGLLGVNGAGKTTTFKMLTGDEMPTRGDALANHYKLSEHRSLFLSQLGYCPQFDAINESLTGREMLVTFARLRGTPSSRINYEVNKWLYLLGLMDYADRLCGTYSGGNKRKLSTAMALIAEPPIVLLDEPTSGVDPISRRNLWNVLSKIQKQSIVLTSHSMEECEALCNRLAIMVNGQFKCVGTVQYLKHRFGQGFTIILKIRSGPKQSQINNLKTNIEREFMCELKDEHEGLLHYHVTNPQTSWYHLFDKIEKLRTTSGLIEDYTISETTLEQVFLSFARQQRDEDDTVYTEPNGKLHDV